MKQLMILSVVACLAPAWASDPGEPLDCGDWVFLEPGLSCAVFAPPQCTSDFCDSANLGTGQFIDEVGNHRAIATDGSVYMVRKKDTGQQCGEVWKVSRLELVRFDGLNESVAAYLQERCTPIGSNHRLQWVKPLRWSGTTEPSDFQEVAGVLTFDPFHGRVLIPFRTGCIGSACTPEPQRWIAAIEGFTTTFEILQTYTPTANEISFRVPYMPEGFQFADHFDTYWGDLTTVGDWSQAQALQCGYPATAPSVGDYLTVDDTLPALESGQGRYYVTSVTYQGQTRYGRKSSGGVLTGRDPAVLPGCGE